MAERPITRRMESHDYLQHDPSTRRRNSCRRRCGDHVEGFRQVGDHNSRPLGLVVSLLAGLAYRSKTSTNTEGDHRIHLCVAVLPDRNVGRPLHLYSFKGEAGLAPGGKPGNYKLHPHLFRLETGRSEAG